MKKKTGLRILLTACLTAATVFFFPGMHSYAGFAEISQNTILVGTTGQNMTVSFQYTSDQEDNERDYYAGIYCLGSIDDLFIDQDSDTSGIFPFEIPKKQNATVKIGKLKKGTHTVAITMKVRRDISAGYYQVPVFVSPDENAGYDDFIKIYIKEAKAGSESDAEKHSPVTFELGEGQITPYGVYPQVMDFSLNLRNSGTLAAQDVKASIVCDKSSENFPFDINETNYDRHFPVIEVNETVSLPYSFAIRENTYTGFYPIKMNVTYRESGLGEIKKEELLFFVHIKNKEKADEARDFNANDRVKARIIVDSYRTDPETVYAGQSFDLYVRMKNASENVPASNILFTFESEKVSDSPVFTTKNGSSSLVVSSMPGGKTEEIHMTFSTKAGADPRSYFLTINEKYDSPEFKNAEEKVSIDIPLLQVSKFNLGNIELLPEEVSVGEEINVMFPINNTGKTMLYNCMVRFEDDTIRKSEVYIGNLKPGETGNVDVMLKTLAPTADNGDHPFTVSYENEFGDVTETEKVLNFHITEPISFNTEDFDFTPPAETGKTVNKKLIAGIVIGVLILLAAGIMIHKKKKNREKKYEAQ